MSNRPDASNQPTGTIYHIVNPLSPDLFSAKKLTSSQEGHLTLAYPNTPHGPVHGTLSVHVIPTASGCRSRGPANRGKSNVADLNVQEMAAPIRAALSVFSAERRRLHQTRLLTELGVEVPFVPADVTFSQRDGMQAYTGRRMYRPHGRNGSVENMGHEAEEAGVLVDDGVSTERVAEEMRRSVGERLKRWVRRAREVCRQKVTKGRKEADNVSPSPR
jgi:hypothetical protein